MTAALVLFILLDVSTPLWIVEVSLFLIGTGVAFIMPSASTAVMAAVPKQRAGSASALSNAFRQVGGALGNAVLGAVLAATYRAHVGRHLQALPGPLRDSAAGSIQATQAVLDELGLDPSQAREITEASNHAFISGSHAACFVGVGITTCGALLVRIALPSRRRPEPDV